MKAKAPAERRKRVERQSGRCSVFEMFPRNHAKGIALILLVFCGALGHVSAARGIVPATPEDESFPPSVAQPAREELPFTPWSDPRATAASADSNQAAEALGHLDRTAVPGLENRRNGEPAIAAAADWEWQLLPDGVVYPSYLAGLKEPRLASVWNHDSRLGWVWDLEAGARMAVVRYGTAGWPRPNGWELDIEGAAFPRLDIDHEQDLISADFRVGVPLTYGSGPFQAKLACYHLSSHLGDEYLLRFPDADRVNYSRNALVLGGSYHVRDDLRLYAEAEWAFYTDGGSKPWEFQLGIDYTPDYPADSRRGAPFVALNGQLREEVDYGGGFVAQAGWQWRGPTNRLFRVGVQYSTGKSDQYQFCQRNEDKVGIGIWYDF